MKDVLSKLNQLEMTVKKVTRQVEFLKNENAHLKTENAEFKEKLGKMEMGGVIGTTNTDFSQNQIDQIKQELEGYVEEIDNCLALLEQ